jgi:XTP/dITP diphosphohydrolase
MRLIFATNNEHKLREVAAILGPGIELVTPASLGITEDIAETADTLEGNALIKARYLFERTGLPTFADDTGLEVSALGGAPGVYSARYAAMAGLGHDFEANNRLLISNLTGAIDRSARFRTVVALILPGRPDDNGKPGVPVEHLFEGRVDGHITDDYRGDGGFGYDPIFIPAGHNTTFAEMSAEQKNTISHRSKAIKKLTEFFNRFTN